MASVRESSGYCFNTKRHRVLPQVGDRVSHDGFDLKAINISRRLLNFVKLLLLCMHHGLSDIQIGGKFT